MSQPPGDQPDFADQNSGFGRPPSGGPDFVGAGDAGPGGGQPPTYGRAQPPQDFRQPQQDFQQAPTDAPPPHQDFQQPQQDFQQPQQDFQQGQQQGFHSPSIQPPRTRSAKPWIIVAVVVVAVALIGAGVFFGRGLLNGGGPTPGQPPGQGELPDNPTIEAPAVIDEVAETAGLTCHDEAVNPRKIKGCYLQEENHQVRMRYLIGEQGEITKVTAQVLLNGATAEERGEELLALLEPVLATLPIAEADQDQIRTVIAAGPEDPVNERIDWDGQEGTFDLHGSSDVTNVSLGNGVLDFVGQIPLIEDHTPFVDELTARGWACETDDVILTCEAGGLGKLTGTLSTAGQPNNEPRLTRIQVWYDGQEPTPDEERMVDVYTALAKAGERGEVMAIGLRMLAEGEKQFFNSDVQFYRGDSYFEVSGVQFT